MGIMPKSRFADGSATKTAPAEGGSAPQRPASRSPA
jgi:hypothetical protein